MAINNLRTRYYTENDGAGGAAQQAQYRNEWERVRWQTAVMLSPHSKQPVDPLKLIRFSWERDTLTISEKIDKYKTIFEKLTPIAQA